MMFDALNQNFGLEQLVIVPTTVSGLGDQLDRQEKTKAEDQMNNLKAQVKMLGKYDFCLATADCEQLEVAPCC